MMHPTPRRSAVPASVLLGAAVLLAFAAAPSRAAERTETVRREVDLAGAREISVDNVFGPVTVHGGGPAGRVTFEIRQHVSAPDAADLDTAFREVTLSVENENGRLELMQDGPFRCNDHSRSWGSHSHCDWDPDYDVRWEWEVTVPAQTDLEAMTVNGGALEVAGVTGRVRARNVNGSLRLTGLAGELEATTVNGGVEAQFERPPQAASKLLTVNGRIEVSLPRDTAAEISAATVHGDLYTNFDAEAVPVKAVSERDGGGHRWRFGGDTVVRIGGGGVRIECKTVNGDIRVSAR